MLLVLCIFKSFWLALIYFLKIVFQFLRVALKKHINIIYLNKVERFIMINIMTKLKKYIVVVVCIDAGTCKKSKRSFTAYKNTLVNVIIWLMLLI
jgi:hypothetical protein